MYHFLSLGAPVPDVVVSGHGYVAGPLPRLELHASEGAAAGATLGTSHGRGEALEAEGDAAELRIWRRPKKNKKDL